MEEYSLTSHRAFAAGISAPHELVFDFARGSSSYAVGVRANRTWVVPAKLYQQASDDDFQQQPGTDRVMYMLDFDRFAAPPWPGRLFGYSEQSMRSFVVTRLSSRFARLYDLLERAPTSEEVRLLAEYDAKDFRTASILPATYVGAFAGFGMLRPSKKWETGTVKAPITGRVLFEGSRAKLIQRFTRASIMGGLGFLFSQAVIAATLRTFPTDASKNPALTDIKNAQTKFLYAQRDAIRESMHKGGSGTPRPSFGPARVDPTGQGETEMTEKWRRHRAGIGASEARRDPSDDPYSSQVETIDRSSYGEGEMIPRSDFAAEEARPTQSVSTPASISDMQSSEDRRAFSSWGSDGSEGIKPEASAEANDRSGDFLYGEDTNSPSSSSVSAKSSSANAVSSGRSLSAWERIRRGEGVRDDAAPSRRAQAPGKPTWGERDRSAFGSEDNSRAKEQAAFDKMLERERAGDGESTAREGRW